MLFSCGQSEHETALYDVAADAVMTENIPSTAVANSISPPDAQRKIVKTGELSFETANAAKTREMTFKKVAELGGYIAEDNAQNYSKNTNYRLTIRIPAEKFDNLLENISQNVQKLDSKTINASDVTEEFIDIEARIKTKKELETRYKELLKRANSVDDILRIEKEAETLREDIESFEGRLKYLNDRVTFSTLTIHFYEPESAAVRTFGFGSKFGSALHEGWDNLLYFFIALANIWTFLLLGIAAIIGIRWFRKRKKK
ncbi:hypothetical protein FACS189430_09140 [Bacteroidia bacterium]|nr:hypothetical protein FACS189430_09140 [Bacteroidia bacterium]